HLGAQAIDEIVAAVEPHYGADCPAAVVARASWPDEVVLRGTLATIAEQVADAGVKRTATILIGPALEAARFRDSHLYSKERARRVWCCGGGRGGATRTPSRCGRRGRSRSPTPCSSCQRRGSP